MEREAASVLVDDRSHPLFNAWQDREGYARATASTQPRYASDDRYDPYNSARLAAWMIMALPPAPWRSTWICKGVYDPAIGRIR